MNLIFNLKGLFIFGISFFICFSFIGLYPIYILDEARNSEAAREMWSAGNYIVPYFNGQLRTDKPPLHYFFMMLGFELFGVNSFGARFFSGFFGAMTIWCTYWFIKKNTDIKIAFITVIILISALFFVQEFHLAVPDPYLIFFVSFALFSFYQWYGSSDWKWFFAFYGAIGLGILTKGPIALALPVMIVTVFLLIKKDFKLKRILKLKPLLGLLLVLLISVPWYYMVHLKTDGEWTRAFFLEHNVSRFGSQKEGHGGFFLVTPLYVLMGLLPFSVFSIQAFIYGWINRKGNDFILFSWISSIVTILFFSISSTKLPNYPMPCYPFIAVLIGHFFYGIYQNKITSRSLHWSMVVLLVISICIPIGGYIALGFEKQFLEVQMISMLLLVTAITGIIGFIFFRKHELVKAFWSIALGWTITGLCLFGLIYPVLTQYSPVSLAKKLLPNNAEVVVFKRFDSAFPINFKRTYQILNTTEELTSTIFQNPEIYVLTNTRNKEDLKILESMELVLEQKALFENNTTRIYKKRVPNLNDK